MLGTVGIIIFLPGIIMVLSASWLVKRFGLQKNAICEHEDEMTEDEIENYKMNKAVLNFKMTGMLIALPGLIMIMIGFK